MELWKIVYWLLSTLGVAGTIALFVFFPAAATIAFQAVVRFFTILLSYRAGCALIAAVLAWCIADYVRHSIEDNKHAAEIAEYERKQDERDKRIAQETRDKVTKEIADAAVENAATDNEVKVFTDALPPIPATGNPFAVGADACRLRALAGQAECGPKRSKGMPAPDANHGGRRDQ